MQSTRSMRKRKQVNYVEPAVEDPEWLAETPKKKVKSGKSSVAIKQKNDATVIDVASPLEGKGKTSESELKSKSTSTGMQDAPFVVEPTSDDAVVVAPKKQTLQTQSRTQAPKRKRNARDDELEWDEDGEEIRKRDFQYAPSEGFHKKKDRALTHAIFFVDRRRCDREEYPAEQFTILGSSNYTVTISLVPKCSCPDGIFGRSRGHCKHILYTLVKVLKVSEDSHLLYQLAFTSDELHKIFEQAPDAPFIDLTEEEDEQETNRKPIEGECPICYMEFEPGQEVITYCKAHCGNNVHQECIQKWLQSQRLMYGKGTCPYCRMHWAT